MPKLKRNATTEERRQYQKEYRAANKDKMNAYAREYSKSPLQRQHKAEYILNTKFGITIQDKQSMLESQGGRCKICLSEIDVLSKAAVDHSHITGIIRGILCISCNGFVVAAIEKLGPKGIEAVIAYLIDAQEPGWMNGT